MPRFMIENFTNYIQTADPLSAGMISLLIGVGIFVGFVNTLAGMATALSYALFMAMGMPINVANGTTRVGVLAQFAVSSVMFKKSGYLDTKLATKVGIPVAIGSLAGAQAAAVLNPSVMEIAMGIMLPIMAIMLLYSQHRRSKADASSTANSTTRSTASSTAAISSTAAAAAKSQAFSAAKFIAFIFIGAYGGFTHAGVGILIIFGSFYLLGLDILRANGIKQFAVVIYTPIALTIFIIHGQVNWPVALIYSIGNVTGAILASRYAVKWGAKAVNYIIAIAVFAMSFWLIYKNAA
ncbi:sulfite exporter TauE/SafE family protein [Bacteroidales bacterium MB20-C3-3]|nr:sulfite exporter TauE/SafE family protein [Bacteroidales bacterium MB20-C3-3]